MVENGVGQGGIGNAAMRIRNGGLCGNEGGGMSEAIIEDFKNVLCVLGGDGIPHPIIEEQQAAFGEPRRVLVREPSLRTWLKVCSATYIFFGGSDIDVSWQILLNRFLSFNTFQFC